MKFLIILLSFLNLTYASECIRSPQEITVATAGKIRSDADIILESRVFSPRSGKFEVVKELNYQKGWVVLPFTVTGDPQNTKIYIRYNYLCMLTEKNCLFVYTMNPATNCFELHSIPNIGGVVTFKSRKVGRLYTSYTLKSEGEQLVINREGKSNNPSLYIVE